MEKITLQIDGMDCSNCALGIQRFLEQQDTEDAQVSFTNSEATFQLNDAAQHLPNIINGIQKLGYNVVLEGEEKPELKTFWTPERKTIFAGLFTIPLLLSMLIHWEWLHHPLVQLALSTPVFILGLAHFGRGAYYSLKSGVANMDVLIIGGAIAAYVYSLYGTLTAQGPQFLFYETTASIIFFTLIGHLVEHRAVEKTTSAVDALVSLQHTKAKKITQVDGEEVIQEIDSKDIQSGDILLVNTGDIIPTDGNITWGEGTVDESMITGESIPIEKTHRQEVIGGTLLEGGTFKMMATKVGRQSMLSQIIALVKDAQSQKPKIQKLSDQISAVFVPLVVGIAVLTFVLSYFAFGLDFRPALIHSIAVLVISCPCAMGLAVPTAVVVGIGKAAKKGILIKGADTLERLSKAETVIFDKTGTLTTGDFEIQKIEPLADVETDTIKSIVYSLERYSSHPIAISLTKTLAGTKSTMLFDVKEIKGLGMEGKDRDGNFYQLGSLRLVEDDTLHATDASLYLLKNRQLMARLFLKDEIKTSAPALIQYLHQKNIKTVVLSGDTQYKTETLSQQLGILEFYAQKSPQEKLDILDELASTQKVIMLGDGINDAPALAKAFVGISLSNANQVAINAAQIILLNGDLTKLRQAFEIGSDTIKVIKQNLFWAFGYNIVAIPMAAVGWLTPMLASLSMAFSDVVVVLNALRLRYLKS